MGPTSDKGSILASREELLSLVAISKTEFSLQNSISVLETDVAVIKPINTMSIALFNQPG